MISQRIPICMAEEYWANSQLSVARYYGQISYNGRTFWILDKHGHDLWECTRIANEEGREMAEHNAQKVTNPCWSLTALLAQMPCVELVSSQDNKYRVFWKDRFSEWHENAVDACVELLERVGKEEEK